jgi:hypothetical protein
MTSDKEGFFLLELAKPVFGSDRDNKKDGEPAAPEFFSTSFITLSVGPSSEGTFLSYLQKFFLQAFTLSVRA